MPHLKTASPRRLPVPGHSGQSQAPTPRPNQQSTLRYLITYLTSTEPTSIYEIQDNDSDGGTPQDIRTAAFTPPPGHSASNLPPSWFGIVERVPLQLRVEWPRPPSLLEHLELGTTQYQRLPWPTTLMPASSCRDSYSAILGQPIRATLRKPWFPPASLCPVQDGPDVSCRAQGCS